MKSTVLCSVLFLTLFLSTQVCGSAFDNSDFELNLESPPETSLVALHRNARSLDVFDFTRAVIQSLINDLQNAGNVAAQAAVNLTGVLNNEAQLFLEKVNKTLNGIMNQVDQAVQNILNSGQTITIVVTECLNQQQAAAEDLVNITLTNAIGCASGAIKPVINVLTQSQDLGAAALKLALDIGNSVSACGVATLQNFLQVGSCLNKIITDKQSAANDLVLQSSALVTTAVTSVSSIPINLSICAGSTLAQAGLTVLSIVQQIGQCAVSSLG